MALGANSAASSEPTPMAESAKPTSAALEAGAAERHRSEDAIRAKKARFQNRRRRRCRAAAVRRARKRGLPTARRWAGAAWARARPAGRSRSRRRERPARRQGQEVGGNGPTLMDRIAHGDRADQHGERLRRLDAAIGGRQFASGTMRWTAAISDRSPITAALALRKAPSAKSGSDASHIPVNAATAPSAPMASPRFSASSGRLRSMATPAGIDTISQAEPWIATMTRRCRAACRTGPRHKRRAGHHQLVAQGEKRLAVTSKRGKEECGHGGRLRQAVS